MHHEFAHILHQTKNYDQSFKRISESFYIGGDWIYASDEDAQKKGFITAYAQNEANEDFVEMSKSVNLRHSLIQKIHKLTGEIICEDKPEVFLEDLNIDRTTLWKHCKKMDLFKDFYWRRSQESQSVKFFMGCDVGKNGAISLIAEDKSIIWNFQMPKNSNEIDVNRLSTFLKFHKRFVSHCVVEDVHSIFGAGSKANFQFGRSLGLLEGVLIASKIPFTKITPKNWQSVIWEGVQPIEVNTGKKTPQGNIKYKTDTKATSLIAIKKLFPEANLTASDRSKKPSDGIVDSLAPLGVGTYNVFVRDANLCETAWINNPVIINSIGGATIADVLATDATCGNSDGTITITATGGTGILEYSIDGGTTWQ